MWLISLVSVIPAICLLLILSGNGIYYYYPAIRITDPSGGPLNLHRGTLYWVLFTEVYLLEVIALVLLLRRFIMYRNIYRRQMVLLIAAVSIPWVANIYFQLAPRLALPPWLYTSLDLTPLMFSLSVSLIAAAIFGLKLFDLVPVARHKVLEYIPQMVFVMDADDRVLDINDTGKKWLGKSAERVIGSPLTEVFKEWNELVTCYQKKPEALNEVQISSEPSRTLEVVFFPVYNRSKLEGRVCVAHDISNRIKLETELKQNNETIRAKLAEIELLREKLEEQAIRDPLTGVYNRRFLSESLDSELERASRTSAPVSVVILDVDHFKIFNDMHGHKCGDVVLQVLAKMLVNSTRRNDVVCRYGGEEFTILMPNSSLEAAYEAADRWRRAFESTLVEFDGQLLSTTFSAGVACFPIHGSTGEAVLQAADHAMYRSKNKGRNQVNIF